MTQTLDSARMYVDVLKKLEGRTNPDDPICFAYHKEFGWVPVIEVRANMVIWNDGQTSRSIPPEDEYEAAEPQRS